jgi:hypothetical protein
VTVNRTDGARGGFIVTYLDTDELPSIPMDRPTDNAAQQPNNQPTTGSGATRGSTWVRTRDGGRARRRGLR